ncbi:antibiotic biosynthesis monooxygenase family protein [Nocardia sp. NPDC051750]|uniref:antibiotic biosynthesis monooxygenase family protein n=1 Tax=Nocardia sp. NPDC051750 TaxID=3364325 RepID=UPI00379680A8
MIIEHAEFRVKSGASDAFEAAFEQVRALLLEADGCLRADLLRSVDVIDTFLLRVEWERLEDHTEVFASTAASRRLAAAIAPHCDGPPRVMHFFAQ